MIADRLAQAGLVDLLQDFLLLGGEVQRREAVEDGRRADPGQLGVGHFPRDVGEVEGVEVAVEVFVREVGAVARLQILRMLRGFRIDAEIARLRALEPLQERDGALDPFRMLPLPCAAAYSASMRRSGIRGAQPGMAL